MNDFKDWDLKKFKKEYKKLANEHMTLVKKYDDMVNGARARELEIKNNMIKFNFTKKIMLEVEFRQYSESYYFLRDADSDYEAEEYDFDYITEIITCYEYHYNSVESYLIYVSCEFETKRINLVDDIRRIEE